MMPKSRAMKRGLSRRDASTQILPAMRIGMEEVVAEHLRVEQAARLFRPGRRDRCRPHRARPDRRPECRARVPGSVPTGGVRPMTSGTIKIVASRGNCAATDSRSRLRAADRVVESGWIRFGDNVARADLVRRRMPALGQFAERTQQVDIARRCAPGYPGRSTLTTTSSRPDRGKRAACTWAIEAEASGCSSNSAKQFAIGAPSAASIGLRASLPGKGVTCPAARSVRRRYRRAADRDGSKGSART